MSTVRTRNGAVVALVVLLGVIVLAVLASRDVADTPEPSRGVSVERQREALSATWEDAPLSTRAEVCGHLHEHGSESVAAIFLEGAPEFDADVVAAFFTEECSTP